MIEGFTRARVPCGEVTLSVHRAGQGEPVILLHGFPQNHMAWGRVAPDFARQFDTIIPDLRGYGDSDAPADDEGHSRYSKRTMARDIAAMMDALGLRRAHVIGHDRGARVAYRFALDHPDRIGRLGLIEIVPTGEWWRMWDADIALSAYHWTFLAQPYPLPERMIGADPAAFVDWTLTSWTQTGSIDHFEPAALDSYRAQMKDGTRAHAMCADYRAGATTDRADDEADRAAGRMIAAPLRFLWSRHGFPARTGDPARIWRRWAKTVTDRSAPAGHFVMDESPGAVTEAFLPWLAGHDD